MFETLKQQPSVIRAVQYYESLNRRDRLAVNILAAFIGVLILVNGIILPSFNYATSSQQNYQKNLDDYSWMQSNQHLINSKAEINRSGSLLSIVNQTAQSAGISFKRFEPIGENNLNLWVENVGFNRMIQWVQGLSENHGIQIKEIAVDRQANSGTVNARLVLEG